ISVLPGRERCRYQAGVRQILNHGLAWENAWYNCSGLAGLHFKIWDEQHKLQCWIDVKSCDTLDCLCDDSKAAEERSRCVVRMPFQFRAERAEFLLRETAVCQSIEGHQDAQSNSDTAAEASRLRNVALNRASDREWLFPCAVKKQFCCFRHNSQIWTLV